MGISTHPCCHCGKPKGTYPRGLCFACYKIPEIRDKYPSGNRWINGTNKVIRDFTGEAPQPTPTKATPGTASKLEELERRAARGESLFSEIDAPLSDDEDRDPCSLATTVQRANVSEARKEVAQKLRRGAGGRKTKKEFRDGRRRLGVRDSQVSGVPAAETDASVRAVAGRELAAREGQAGPVDDNQAGGVPEALAQSDR